MLISAVQVLAGFGVLAKNQLAPGGWGRCRRGQRGCPAAVIPAYLSWSLAIFTLDILVMHGLLVNGSRTVRPVSTTGEHSRSGGPGTSSWPLVGSPRSLDTARAHPCPNRIPHIRHPNTLAPSQHPKQRHATAAPSPSHVNALGPPGRVSAVAAQNVTRRSLITAIA